MKKIIFLFLMPISPKLAQYSDANLSKYISNIILNVVGNADTFPLSMAMIPALRLKVQEFIVACQSVKHGPAGSAEAKNALRVEVVNMFNQMAVAAWTESNNSIETFSKTGIDTRKPFEHRLSLDTPVGLEMSKGNSQNSLKLKFKKVNGALYYKVIVAMADGTVVKESTSTNSRNTAITGLTKGVEYFVKIAACGTGELMSDWSNMVNCYCS